MNTACLPLACSFVKLPGIPYPYKNVFLDYGLAETVHPELADNNLLEGIKMMKGLQKNAGIPGYLVPLLNFAVRKLFSLLFQKIGRKVGLIKDLIPEEEDYELVLHCLKLTYNHHILQMMQNHRIELIGSIDDDSQMEVKEKLNALDESITELLNEKMEMVNSIQLKFDNFIKHSQDSPVDENTITQIICTWIPSFLASLASDVVMFPLITIGTWYTAQLSPGTWYTAKDAFVKSVRNGTKNPYDGFLMNSAIGLLSSFMILPPMSILKKFMGIPNEKLMRFHFSFLAHSLLVGENRVLKISNAQKKEQLKRSFQTIIKNSVAHSISSWLVGMTIFPLINVRNRLMLQNSPYTTNKYSNAKDAITTIYDNEGIQGFYNGFIIRSLMIIPELALWGLVYVGGNAVIDVTIKEEE